MMTRLRNIGLLILLLFAGRMAAQVPVLDSVCSGAVRNYRVDGEPGSTYSWILTPPAGPVVTLPSDADTLEMTWTYPAGIYILQSIQHAENGCDADAVNGQVIIFGQPDVFAGPNALVCVGRYYKLVNATADNTGSLLWVTSGDGTFDNDTILLATYTPGANDILLGTVTLTLTGTGLLEDGGCDPSVSSLVLTIVYFIVPTFEPIGPLCQYSIPPALPDTSLNGITGTWTPPVINTDFLGTFAYTFRPNDPAQCGVDTTILITITDQITPEFDPIGPLCINSVPPALPDTSNNGITGTWDPPTIDTSVPGIFTYLFTPNDPAQCGVVTTMDIVIVTEINPEFDPIGPLCQYSTPPALPGISLNGITGTWVPPIIDTSVPGIFTFTFTPDPGQCGLDTTIEIIILQQVIPEFDPIGPLCQYSGAPPLPGISLNGITGTWNPAWINTAMPGTFTYIFTPNDPDQCGSIVTMDIIIVPEITPEFEPIGPLCQFSPAPALPDTSLNGIAGTWNPPVISTDVIGTFFFTFTPDTTYQCVLGVSIAVTIVPESPPVFDPIGPLCQKSIPPALPDTSNNGITGTWVPPTIDTFVPGTFTYIFTPDPGQCAIPISITIDIVTEIIPEFDPIGPLCQNSQAPALPGSSLNGITGTWDPPTIDTSVPGTFNYTFTPGDPGQCGVPVNMVITVVTEIIPVFDPIAPLCQNSVPPALPATSNNGITGTWVPPTIDTSVPGLFTYTFTPDPGQCAILVSIAIEIVTEIIPQFDPIGPLCQNSEPPILPVTSYNGITGSWVPPVIDTSIPDTVIYTFTPDEGQCAIAITMNVEINSLPAVYAGADQSIPTGASTTIGDATASGNGPLTYSWMPAGLLLDPAVLNPTTVNLTVTTTFTLTVTDSYGCENSDEVTITVEGVPLQAITIPGDHCLEEAVIVPLKVDKFISVATFQLKLSYNADNLLCVGFGNVNPQLAGPNFVPLYNQAAGEITIQWHSATPVTFNGLEKVCDLMFTPKQPGQGQLDWYIGPTESYFTDLAGLPIPAVFQSGLLYITNPPVILLAPSKTVCVGDTVTIIGAASGQYPPLSYQWTYPDGHTQTTDPFFAGVTQAEEGDYILLVTDSMGCTDQKSIRLIVGQNPVAAFHGSDTMTVPPGYILEAGSGLAFYQWNTGEMTESITIDTTGWYWVDMTSNVGCIGTDSVYVVVSDEVQIECLWIPNAFTPNHDGLNDTFKPDSRCPLSFYRMFIYNRWGEELFESNDISIGWDGTRNGVPFPGDTYVYKIVYRAAGVPETEFEKVKAGTVLILK